MKKISLKTSLIILFIFLFVILVSIGFINHTEILSRITSESKKEVEDSFKYYICNNQGDKIKTLIKVSRADGIDKIEYNLDEGDNLIINCYGKKGISFDVALNKNQPYTFDILLANGEEQQEEVNITDEVLNNFATVTQLSNSNGAARFHANYDELSPEAASQRTLSYKSKSNSAWTNYTDPLTIRMSQLNPSDFVNYNQAKMQLRKIDKGGNIVTSDYTGSFSGTNFDVFENAKVNNISLANYGFTKNFISSVESSTFDYYNLYVFHGSLYATMEATFTLNWTKLQEVKANTLYIKTTINARKGYDTSAWGEGNVTITYEDNTTQVANIARVTNQTGVVREVNMTLKQNTQVKKVDIHFKGYDNYHDATIGMKVEQIILKNLS